MNTLSPDSIKQLLEVNPKAVERGILAVYQRQTLSEQSSYCTKETNGIGFNSADAPVLTRYAKVLLANGCLNMAQAEDAKRRIQKYSRQLMEIAMEKQLAQLTEVLAVSNLPKLSPTR